MPFKNWVKFVKWPMEQISRVIRLLVPIMYVLVDNFELLQLNPQRVRIAVFIIKHPQFIGRLVDKKFQRAGPPNLKTEDILEHWPIQVELLASAPNFADLFLYPITIFLAAFLQVFNVQELFFVCSARALKGLNDMLNGGVINPLVMWDPHFVLR